VPRALDGSELTVDYSIPRSIFRTLACNSCGESVEVIEIPRRWIDPKLYRCGECMRGAAEQLALGLEKERRREERRYDPAQSELPI
jgi:hypothetical protein